MQDPRKSRRAVVLAAAGAIAAGALVLTASGGAAVQEQVTPTAKKLALVLPDSQMAGVAAKGLSTAIDSAAILYDLETQVASVDARAPDADVDRLVARIRGKGVGLVVALGDGPASRAVASVVRSLPETRFVFIDASLRELSLEGAANAAAIPFADEDTFYLAGYASGLVPTMDGSRKRVDTVSVVAGEPSDHTATLIRELRDGVRATRRGVTVRVDYSHELEDVTACENLANRQIDRGADVIVAIAGRCSIGALAVARVRGVWGVGAQEDGIKLTDHLLWASIKEWTPATLFAMERLHNGTLAMGQDTVVGLEDEYAVLFWMSAWIPDRVESAIVEECSEVRARRKRDV